MRRAKTAAFLRRHVTHTPITSSPPLEDKPTPSHNSPHHTTPLRCSQHHCHHSTGTTGTARCTSLLLPGSRAAARCPSAVRSSPPKPPRRGLVPPARSARRGRRRRRPTLAYRRRSRLHRLGPMGSDGRHRRQSPTGGTDGRQNGVERDGTALRDASDDRGRRRRRRRGGGGAHGVRCEGQAPILSSAPAPPPPPPPFPPPSRLSLFLQY